MSEPEETHDRAVRSARSLGRISLVTRIIGILSSLAAILVFFAAQDMSSRSDRTGFSIMSFALLLFGVLVWATGAFHAAVARSLPMLVSVDIKLERALRLLAIGPARVSPEGQAGPAPAPPVLPTQAEAALEPEVKAEPPPARKPPRVEPPPPERTPCPHCGGLVHPDATRCVHCMKKIKR